MKKHAKSLLLLLSFVLGASFLVGCTAPDRGVYGQKTVNYMGIKTKYEEDYSMPDPITMPVSKGDLGVNEVPTGDRTTYLWNLITCTDY